MPAFETITFEPDGIPHMITVTPILTLEEIEEFDELEFAALLPGLIIDSVIERVQAYNQWTRARCLARISGSLNATNNADNKTWDKFQHLIQITPATILDVMAKLAQSDVEVELYNLDWTFTIDPNSLLNGAGGTFPIPTWAGSVRNRETWKEQEYQGKKINCAAFALTWYLTSQPQRFLLFNAGILKL